ncbi:MAG: DAK2 domain-containing protein [Anaerolineales bacterium]
MTDPVTTIDGAAMKRLAQASLTWLRTNHQAVNALNVFPVPDGDTGTNMLLTMQTAVAEVEAANEAHVGKVAHDLAQGALMGARGNSGVILSQILRGIAHSLESTEAADVPALAAALQEASDTAYRGVVKPVEGTILTVIKDAAAAAHTSAANTNDFIACLQDVVAACEASVANTPELLPVLKQAGVVDAGGYGLQILFDGMLRFLRGESLDVALQSEFKPIDMDAVGALLDEMIEPGQDWEVVVDFRPRSDLDLQSFYNRLELIGTSIQVGQGDDLLRVHIHLPKEKRFEPIEYTESLGTVVNVHMENLLDQMAQQGGGALPRVEIEAGQLLNVVVSPARGFDHIFHRPGVALVSGGQTMNPSTQDILRAFEDAPTDKVIVLPNNKNIQLAAEQAAALSVKQVRVLPTRTVPQGIAAQLAFNPAGELDEVVAAMTARIDEVETGEVTTATRDVTLNGVAVREGQIIGLHNGEIKCASKSVRDCVFNLLQIMQAEDYELLTLYHGADVPESAAREIAGEIEAAYGELEVQVYAGGQQHYFYIFSIE